MNSLPIIEVQAAIGSQLLIGATAGQRAGDALKNAAAHMDVGQHRWLALDFKNIEMVSASAAREALFGSFMSDTIDRGLLLICIHLNAESLDEVTFAAEALGRPIVVSTAMGDDQPTGLSVRGGLEPKQMQTLKRVASLGETDAKTAHELSKDGTGVTAWNNRLSSLEAMRLLVERKSGKTKFYSLTLKGLVDGN